jgi:hypothetical protein
VREGQVKKRSERCQLQVRIKAGAEVWKLRRKMAEYNSYGEGLGELRMHTEVRKCE